MDLTPGTTPQTTAKTAQGFSNVLDAALFKGLITNEQYNQVKFESVNSNKTPENVLIEKNIISADAIARLLSEMHNVGFVELGDIYIPSETLQLIPAQTAKETNAVPFEALKNKLKVAMVDPLDLQKVKYLESLTKNKIEAYYATRADIDNVINTKYGAQVGGEVNKALEEVGESADLISQNGSMLNGLQGQENKDEGAAPIIKIVNMVLEYGVNNGASDIHIEPREGKISVRFRIRGLLTEKLTLPRTLISSIVIRIKILSDLKIDEHRIPQDGRFQINTKSGRTDIRVSIMPSVFGEKVVMRLLEKSKGIMNLEDVGIAGVSYLRLKDAISKTQGIVLVTGPTGSGKSQTLASCLKVLNSTAVNIITLEDPVELKIDGVNQVQVNAEVGLTFASGLRAILRQDPDVIMVGEIRDTETATLATQAALVGRLVLSTIHTNSAASSFIRLLDMGIEPFLLSSTINAVVAQRLIRVLCECKEAYEATPEVVQQLHQELDVLNGINIFNSDKTVKLQFNKDTTKIVLHKAKGCAKCNQTGFISRTGIFEAIKMSETIANLVNQRKSVREIQTLAIQEGMITMVQDGFIKVLEGITTLEEILRVRNE